MKAIAAALLAVAALQGATAHAAPPRPAGLPNEVIDLYTEHAFSYSYEIQAARDRSSQGFIDYRRCRRAGPYASWRCPLLIRWPRDFAEPFCTYYYRIHRIERNDRPHRGGWIVHVEAPRCTTYNPWRPRHPSGR